MITPAYQEGFCIKTADIVCNQAVFPDIPDLKTGIFEGVTYFDANAHQRNFNIDRFVHDSLHYIKAIQKEYNIDNKHVFVQNNEGHACINADLLLLYMMYVDSNFLAYTFESINTMLSAGICISDSFLLTQTVERFTLPLIQKVYEQRKETQNTNL